MNNNNVIKFHNLVKTNNWSFVCLESSCQASFLFSIKNYLSILTLAFPLNINRKFWLSDTLKKIIIEKNKA